MLSTASIEISEHGQARSERNEYPTGRSCYCVWLHSQYGVRLVAALCRDGDDGAEQQARQIGFQTPLFGDRTRVKPNRAHIVAAQTNGGTGRAAFT